MKITIESTDQIIWNQGRIWNGVTEHGVPCKVLVVAIGSEDEQSLQALQPELATLEGPGDVSVGVLTFSERADN